MTLLQVCFDVLIAYGDERDLEAMIPIMFERMDQLFPLEVYQDRIRKVLIEKIVAIFEKFPTFIYSLKKWIVMMMNDSGMNRQREELVLHLCWLIGEFSQPNGPPGPQIMHDYEEVSYIVINVYSYAFNFLETNRTLVDARAVCF